MVKLINYTALIIVPFLIVFNLSHVNCLIDDALDVLHVTKEVVQGVLKAWDIVEQTSLSEHIELPFTREKQKKVLRQLRELSRKIDMSEALYTNNAEWTIEAVTNFMSKNSRLENEYRSISEIINNMHTRLKQMQQYEQHRDEVEEQTIVKFSDWTVSPNPDSVMQQLERLHLILVGPDDIRSQKRNFLQMVSEGLEEGIENLCQTKQSAQQFLYSLYTDIALTELKGYTMMQFSYMMLRIYGKGNFSEESRLMRENFENRTENTQKLLQNIMKRADRIVWQCDPIKHVKGKTYDEVTRLLQGYIENEVDLNGDETCRENCAYYQIAKNHGCFKDLYCSRQQRCTGKLLNCQYVDSDMWICPAAYNSTRRYDYIEYENGRVLGSKGSCPRGQTKVDSWWRWLFWHCSYCFCLCDEQGMKSDRYFNLRETLSDTNNNKVVTGLRFIKHKRIFHIQIQEGELQPNGVIKQDSLNWKPVDDYQIFDRNVRSKIDYHTLAWDNRAIDLDDIQGDDSTHIVTGVRFRVVGTHLNLEARLTEYNFETGKLIDPVSQSYWKSNDNTDVSGERRTQIKLDSPDVSTRTTSKSIPMSRHNQFIEFTNSDMDKDAAQSTVPFIDIQDVVSSPPVPLAGIGIYHKGRKQFGGFLAPKLITYDFSSHIHPPIKA